MKFSRASGVLLHPTSLPGPYGIGEIGPEAYRFADFLQATGQHLWQILPLGPTSFGDSPYQSPSTCGNPSGSVLTPDGTNCRRGELTLPGFPANQVVPVIIARLAIPNKVCLALNGRRPNAAGVRGALRPQRLLAGRLCALFRLKDAHGGVPWTQWGGAGRYEFAAPQVACENMRRKSAPYIIRIPFERQWQHLALLRRTPQTSSSATSPFSRARQRRRVG